MRRLFLKVEIVSVYVPFGQKCGCFLFSSSDNIIIAQWIRRRNEETALEQASIAQVAILKQRSQKKSSLYLENTQLTRWYCREHNAPYPLIQPTEEYGSVYRPRSGVLVKALIMRRLNSSLEGIKRVNEEIDRKCCKGSSLY